MVLKPVASAGSEGVFFATTMQECRRYYDEIFGSTNVFGCRNDSVLLQEVSLFQLIIGEGVERKGGYGPRSRVSPPKFPKTGGF